MYQMRLLRRLPPVDGSGNLVVVVVVSVYLDYNLAQVLKSYVQGPCGAQLVAILHSFTSTSKQYRLGCIQIVGIIKIIVHIINGRCGYALNWGAPYSPMW